MFSCSDEDTTDSPKMFFIVPDADKTEKSFIVGPIQVLLPLESNTVITLLSVAQRLSFPRQRGKKAELLEWINGHLSLISMETALASYPALKGGGSLYALANTIRREAPQFIPHVESLIYALDSHSFYTTDDDEEVESRIVVSPPAWWFSDWMYAEAKASPHYRITVRITHEIHPCKHCEEVTDADLEEGEPRDTVLYLPLTNDDGGRWDFNTKMIWHIPLPGHRCDAQMVMRLWSWEKILYGM